MSAIYDYNGGGTVVRGLSRPMTTNGALTASVEGRFSRDTAGRLRTAHWSRASNWGGGHVYGSVTYQYDAAGRRVRATDERNLSWIYAYNSRGELTDAQKTTASGAALPGWAHGYAYDDIGNRVLTQTAEGESRISTANDLNQITSRQGEQSRWLRGRAPVSATVEVRSNLVSDQGTSLTVTREGEVWRSLLPAPPREDWLRANLARVSIQGSNEAELRKVVFTPTQVISTHDADGNLTFDGRWSYEWDGENRLKAMQSGPVARAKDPTNVYLSIEPAVRLEFQYDGLGRRIWKRVLTAPVTFQGQIQTWTEQEKWLYVWQDWRLLGEYRHQSSGSNPGWRLRRSYVWGMDLVSGVYDRQMSESGSALNPAGGVGGLLWCLDYDTTSQTSYRQMAPWYDGNGNILGWIENHAVQVKALRRIEYDPFGRLLTSDPLRKPHPLGSGEDSNYDEFPPFGFSTKFEDVETGLLYYGYRYYDPVTGRWPSRDPIGERGGINLYGVVVNDAVNRVDFLGLTDIRVVLNRESTGYVNTYGSVVVTIENERINTCCKIEKFEWKTLELAWGDYPLRIGANTRPEAPRPFRNGGPFLNAALQNANTTSPQALAGQIGGALPARENWMHKDDYSEAIKKAFNTGNGDINIHAGRGSWDSLFCPIIGNTYVSVWMPPHTERHPYPGVPDEPDGMRYQAWGFDASDSLKAQVEFNIIFACAERALSAKPKVSFSLGSAAAPPFRGEHGQPRPFTIHR